MQAGRGKHSARVQTLIKSPVGTGGEIITITVQTESGGRITDHTLEFRAIERNAASSGQVECVFDGEALVATWSEVEPGVYSFLLNGRSAVATVLRATPRRDAPPPASKLRLITVDGYAVRASVADPRSRRIPAGSRVERGPLEVLAPMPGRIVKLLVSERSGAQKGDGLMIIEAMKMQNEIRAPRAGTVAKLYVTEGAGVEAGARLLRLE